MGLYKDILSRKEKIALVGLGYVGMPIAVEFAKHCDVIGYDINRKKLKHIRTVLIQRLKSATRPSGTHRLIGPVIQLGSKRRNSSSSLFQLQSIMIIRRI